MTNTGTKQIRMTNTGTKQIRIMKQTAFKKNGEYTPFLKYSLSIFVE